MISRKRAARLVWLSHFDFEHLVSSLLRNGTLGCVSLAAVGLMFQHVLGSQAHLNPTLQARSVPSLLVFDFQHRDTPGFWLDLLIDTTVALLMLIPYIRLLVSALYMSLIERERRLSILIWVTLLILTIAVLTDLV